MIIFGNINDYNYLWCINIKHSGFRALSKEEITAVSGGVDEIIVNGDKNRYDPPPLWSGVSLDNIYDLIQDNYGDNGDNGYGHGNIPIFDDQFTDETSDGLCPAGITCTPLFCIDMFLANRSNLCDKDHADSNRMQGTSLFPKSINIELL